ncbi:MAG: succinate dehydrogenase cytochrome b subunit [Flavobacteriales bacterium]|tara:strand:- start:705 stop:1391 length:687 start_codon:yes stop_codon:yes gene_type:complete
MGRTFAILFKSKMELSSIVRKFIMALSGLFLIIFLITHLVINSLTLASSKDLFNEAAHFMATNPIIYAMQYVLALGFIIHIGMGIKLTIQNKRARSQEYVYNKMSKNTDLSSRSMIVSGGLVIVFLALHLRDYFYQMKFVGLPEGTTDYDLVVNLFTNPYYTAVYVIAFIVLGVHLNHGFKSAFQSMGANHKKYNPLIKIVSTAYSIVIALGFSTIAIFHFINQSSIF